MSPIRRGHSWSCSQNCCIATRVLTQGREQRQPVAATADDRSSSGNDMVKCGLLFQERRGENDDERVPVLRIARAWRISRDALVNSGRCMAPPRAHAEVGKSQNSALGVAYASRGTRLRLIRFPAQPSWSGTRKSNLIIFSVNFHTPFTRSSVSS